MRADVLKEMRGDIIMFLDMEVDFCDIEMEVTSAHAYRRFEGWHAESTHGVLIQRNDRGLNWANLGLHMIWYEEVSWGGLHLMGLKSHCKCALWRVNSDVYRDITYPITWLRSVFARSLRDCAEKTPTMLAVSKWWSFTIIYVILFQEQCLWADVLVM